MREGKRHSWETILKILSKKFPNLGFGVKTKYFGSVKEYRKAWQVENIKLPYFRDVIK
jgi:hypothetical protein